MKNIITRGYTLDALSTLDTVFYKGLAITMIVLHKFLHWVYPKIGENEMSFKDYKFEKFLDLVSTQPEYTIQAVFSYFGHYGVQMFIFLSAYGLAVKYYDTITDYSLFVFKRVSKIYKPFIYTLVFYFIYKGLVSNGLETMLRLLDTQIESIFYKLTFVSNFIKGELYTVNGPWWFIALIVQLYIVIPFLFNGHKKMGSEFLLLIASSSVLFTYCMEPFTSIKLHGTIVGHLPEICIGIYLARKGKTNIPYLFLAVALGVFYMANVRDIFWELGFASILLILLGLFQWLNKNMGDYLKSKFMFIGVISMYMFYINGFMRSPWYQSARDFGEWYINLGLCALFFATVVLVAHLLHSITCGKPTIVDSTNTSDDINFEKANKVVTV